MYDLLIKGGRVIDPAQNLDDILDVAINGGKIATVAKDIPSQETRQVVDAADKIITPGLIDVHCHVYDGVIKIAVEPDTAGVKQGVTTVVDGGSAGEASFGGFLKYIIPSSRTTVFCFLNLDSRGQIVTPEMREWDDANLDAIVATTDAHRDIIKGIKLRLVGKFIGNVGVEVVKVAKKAAKKCGLPLMVHIGDYEKKVSPTLTQEFLPLMETGDILSHFFTAKHGSPMRPDGTVIPELKEAMERGVILDTAVGKMNFSFDVARKSMAQGILPTTVSTDLTTLSLYGPTYGLTATMSRFMALGLDLKQLIEMTTINPARAISAEKKMGSLKPGMDADVSILELLAGTWRLEDSEQQTIKATKLISPVSAVKSGQLIPSQPVSQPQPVD